MTSSRGSSMKHGEIMNALRNSPKGQLKYDTGWDLKPNAVAHLISEAQNVEDEPKVMVLERVMRVMRLSGEKEEAIKKRERETDLESTGTSSGSGSKITLWECGEEEEDGTDDVDRHFKPKRKGYGIREDEYDDEEMEKEFQIQRIFDTKNHLEIVRNLYDERVLRQAVERGAIWRKKLEKELNDRIGHIDVDAIENQKAKEYASELASIDKMVESAIEADMQLHEEQRKAEDDALKQEYEIKLKVLRDRKAKENAAAKVKAAAEERERQLKLKRDQEAAEVESQKQKEKALKDKEEEDVKKLTEIKKAEEDAHRKAEEVKKAAEQAARSQALPSALLGYILKEDCDKYQRCNDLITQYEEATKDIVAGSDNPAIKRFYGAASKCVNTPLNALANTEPGQVAQKINHLINLLDGKPVISNSTMATPFSASDLPNGKAFVLRLLAFRFVKKAESEILSEKKGFEPLAFIAFSISKRFPDWGSLVQAYFYKLCPFLVPFSFPRGEQSLQDYCNSLGYNLQGDDSTLVTEMLNRIKGYCSLYAIMVLVFEKSTQFDIGEATPFFTIGGVWEILAKTLRLEPQPDVTVIVFQTLLELLSDRFNQVYGNQFRKLLNTLVAGYLPKINGVSIGASQSGLSRFKTFIEQKYAIRC